MSAVIASPGMMEAAATDLSAIGLRLSAAQMVAAAPTLSVLPAAADEVSARIANLFSGYAEDYQKLAGQVAVSYEQFVQQLTGSAVSYASAEAANVASLLQPLTTIAAPVAAAAAVAQNVLIDTVISALSTGAVILIGGAVVSVFLAWLSLDLAALFLAPIVINATSTLINSTGLATWLSVAINSLTEVAYSMFTTFPILGQLASLFTSTIYNASFILLLPYILANFLVLRSYSY